MTMQKRLVDNNHGKKRNIILGVLIIFFLTHWQLLIASGSWWDDLCQYGLSTEQLQVWAKDLGRPELAPTYLFFRLLPEGADRIITFIMFYVVTILLYKILIEGFGVKQERALLITLVFAVLPINDAKIMLSVFPYTLGLFFLVTGFYVFVHYMTSKKAWYNRIFSLVLFVLSFTLNSNLVMYVVIVYGYLIWKEKGLKTLYKYSDYILIPFAFYAIKVLLFPSSGLYDEYNQVTISGVLYGIVNFALADAQAFVRVAYAMIQQCFLKNKLILLFSIAAVVITGAFVFAKSKKHSRESVEQITETVDKKKNTKSALIMLLIGFVLLSAALFPYVVVRHSWRIAINYETGRDSILAGFGISLIIISILDLINKKLITQSAMVIFAVMGIIANNMLYLSYQTDYYQQLGMRYQLETHKELSDGGNILVEEEDPSALTRFYTLNVNAEKVYGNQKRFMMRPDDKTYLEAEQKEKLERMRNDPLYHMTEYQNDHDAIDATIHISSEVDVLKTIQLKFSEIFSHDAFRDKIKEYCHMDVKLADEI